MKPNLKTALNFLLLLAAAGTSAAGTAFTYQGRLDSGGSPANGLYDFHFQLFDPSGNSSSTLLPVNAVPVSNGLFTVTLDFGSTPFNGADCYLQIDVGTNGAGTFTALSPRQSITAAPYAIRAALADATTVSLNNTFSGTSGVGGGFGNVASGYLSFVGGGSYNAALSAGSFVGGGGNGARNVGTGYNNIASGFISAVVGGFDNIASGRAAFVGGGEDNVASGTGAFVGGGSTGGLGITNNVASGTSSMIPGGLFNVAAGNYSFAAGYEAKALHAGSFVWNDLTAGNFSSTGNNQFLIHAGGGVGIGKNNPATALDVNGTVTASAFAGSGSGLANLDAGNISSGTLAEARLSGNVALLNLAQTFSAPNTFLNSGNQFTGNGSGLANLNAGNVSSGTLADARLSGNVALLNRSQNSFAGTLSASAASAYTYAFFGQASTATAYGGVFRYGTDGNNCAYLGGNGSAAVFYGTVTVNGTFNNYSDADAKEHFTGVEPAEVLAKVARLPVTEWNYKAEPATRHIGPTAQDFHAAFNLGTDERHIAPMDEGGVALAAIQGLNQKVETQNAALRAENAELRQQLMELKELVLKRTATRQQ